MNDTTQDPRESERRHVTCAARRANQLRPLFLLPILLLTTHAPAFAATAHDLHETEALLWRETRDLSRQPFHFREGGGTWFAGTLVASDASQQRIRLSIPVGHGLVERAIKVDPGLLVQPPGLELLDRLDGLYLTGSRSRTLRESYGYLWSAWERAFWLISDEYLQRLLPLPALALEQGDWSEAMQRITVLLDHLEDDSPHREPLLDLRLAAFEFSGDREAALHESIAWIASRPRFGPSALGYRVAGRIALASGDFETALWTALEPITFSGPLAVESLAECYQIALAATLALDEKEHALLLFREMRDRGLEWPAGHEALLQQLEYLERLLVEEEGREEGNLLRSASYAGHREERPAVPGALGELLRGLRPRIQHEQTKEETVR